MINQKEIQLLLEAGAKAPSGDNSQPWSFHVENNCITIKKISTRDNPFLNFEQSGTLLACGAVIENIVIESTHHNILSEIVLFPVLDDQNIVARITLTKGETIPDPLQEGIAMRETNRRGYQKIPLPNSLKNELLNIANAVQGISFKIAEGEALLKLGFASSRAEIAILEHQELHQLLFSNVVWSKQEELEKKEGLFVKTLELAPPQEFMFKLCRKWSVMNILNKIGFAKIIANDDAKKYATGSAFVAITCNKFDKYSFVNVGRAMERAWLLLNHRGVAVHPITATLFFGHRIRMKKMDSLNSATWTMMGKALDLTRNVLNVNDDEHIMFMFRVGYAKRPSEKSSKKTPVVEYSK